MALIFLILKSSDKKDLNNINANEAVQNLEDNANSDKSSLTSLDSEAAKYAASLGYTVVAACENENEVI